MEPTKDPDALVDVLDVLLRDGVIVRADVIVSIADVPLIGIKLTAAIAGMETMNEYGLFEEWDASRRASAVARRQYTERGQTRRLRGLRAIYGGSAPDAERARTSESGPSEREPSTEPSGHD